MYDFLKTKMRFGALLLAVLAVGGLLAGCAAQPTEVDALVLAQPKLNPDLNARPSPVVVRLFQLKGLNAFQAADYFSLVEHPEALGPELLSSEELLVRPDEALRIKRPILPGATYFAAVAAFRDVDRSRWRVDGQVENVTAIKIPLIGYERKPAMALRIDLADSNLQISSPADVALLDVAQESARIKQAAAKQATASNVSAKTREFIASAANAAVDKAVSAAEDKAKDALLSKLPGVN
ncbi:type VI secretion lipoprotein, VC_A0113 family [Andreprevotia lacus DSM 23236]|jgi:type VI secretion system protein VasD|uniref:Type VI secretion lipoprotein, VC_A0113 family n=1 Tax=Andreprevotia lacus DSM 23236 TaxID=1121001 RepID=A0A1W1XMF8_9NEIS|nr:type VI secretion system lipoprotein TssJ [Andreprevotia lacus]SMC25007.1 type VI secretion lipoprotein, VC_A0113 family [Andreprevotia lacus DSM 23236]